MRDVKHWLKVRAPAGPIDVVAVNHTISLRGIPRDGMLDSGQRRIFVNVDDDASDPRETLFHELVHVAIRNKPPASIRRLIAHLSREEAIVSHLDRQLYDILMLNGWLQLPRPPRMP